MENMDINILVGEKLINLKNIYKISSSCNTDIQNERNYIEEIRLIKLAYTQITEVLDNIYKASMLKKYEDGELEREEYLEKIHSRKLKDNPYFTFE